MTDLCIAPAASAVLWRGLGDVPPEWGHCAVTLGVFDGVHRGHSRLIENALGTARSRGLPTVLVTFDPHPARVVGLPRDTATLSSLDRRAELAGQLGVDAVCVLPFTPEFARVSAEDFVREVLVDVLNASVVVVGSNFTFGHRGAGNTRTLRQLGQRYGFSLDVVDLLHTTSMRCSSTYIRDCLRRGDVEGAADALGRSHRIEGVLCRTGEFTVTADTALPAAGGYDGRLNGTPILLRITEDGVVVSGTGQLPGPGSIDFIRRRSD